ncbi:MAG: hypothetical protein WCT04_21330, partial [Planctomycetota bacterium]
MLKNFLKRWGPALMFVVVLGLSVGLVFLYMDNPREATDVKVALDNKTKLEAALKKGVVSPEYIASPDQVAKIKTSETLAKNLERINSVNPEALGVYVSYPQPVRPKSEQPPPPIGQDDIVAKMPYLAGESCKAEATRGKVYFKCDLPSAANNAYVMMEPIRIEVFRGLAANKIDTTKPWGTIELALEVPPAPKANAGNVAPVVAPVENSRRQPGGSGAAATDRNKKPVPEEPLDPVVRVYRDTKEITLLTEYFYAARLVSKFTS